MSTVPVQYPRKTVNLARVLVLLSTLLWALCFPVPRGQQLLQREMAPHITDQSLVNTGNAVRFTLSFFIMFVWTHRQIGSITKMEWSQGIGMGILATVALNLQTLALLWTDSSIVAFLSQLYTLFVPLMVALRDREFPSGRTLASCTLVAIGVSLLSPGLLTHLSLGKGEIVTIISALFIAGQLLLVNRAAYLGNRSILVTQIMFGFMMVNYLALALFFGHGDFPIGLMYTGLPVKCLTLFVVFFLTIVPYIMMYEWQPKLSVVEASIIYCSEPVMVAILATFVPGWLSFLTGVNYPNEKLSGFIWIGGLLIVLATMLVATEPVKRTHLSQRT